MRLQNKFYSLGGPRHQFLQTVTAPPLLLHYYQPRYLKINASLNKVELDSITNLDGGVFMRTVMAEDLKGR